MMLAITTITTLFCSALIVTAQSTPEEKQIDVEQPKVDTSVLPKPEIPKVEIPGGSTEKETEEKELDERPTFDFSLPGDNRTQALPSFFNDLSSSITLKANLGVGGHIEFESDITIENDPRLNFTLYGEYNPLNFVELAFGGWTEFLRLGKEPLEGERFRFGLRTHCNIEKEFKCRGI